MRRILCRVFAAATTAALAAVALPVSPATAADEVTINLVLTNDFHGQIDEHLVQWAATVDQLLTDDEAQGSLFLSAGDNVGMSVSASAEQHDDPAIDALNLLGLDASSVGNHEFDRGYDDLTGHLMKRADFPILAANVEKADGSLALEPSATFTVAGVRIAVIGAVTDTTPELVVDPDAVAGLTFTDPVAAINRTVDELNALPEDQRPQVMVALVHEGSVYNEWTPGQESEEDAAFAHLVHDTSPDIDVIVTGHTHKHYAVQAPVPGDSGRTRPVIQAGAHGSHVGQVLLTVEPDTGEVVSSQAQAVTRSTESEDALIAQRPFLAQFADLRDQAVAYAAERVAAREATQRDYDAAEAAAQEAYDSAQEAKADYDAAVVARNEAYQAKNSIGSEIETLLAEGRKGYADAAAAKEDYGATLAEGRKGYADAATAKKDYDATLAEGRKGYADAATAKKDYDATLAEGRKGYADAATAKNSYETALAESRQAYGDAAAIKEEYLAVLASGTADAMAQLEDLQTRYYARLTAAQDAYVRAGAQKQIYDTAIATAVAAFSELGVLKGQYDAALATAQAAFGRLDGLKKAYDDALATAQAAFGRLDGLKKAYDDALATAQAAFGRLDGLKKAYDDALAIAQAAFTRIQELRPSYDAAVEVVNQAVQKVTETKSVNDAAVATWQEALATLAQLKEKLLGLLL